MRLANRVGKLEAASGAGKVTVVMWQKFTETEDQAVERWKREHPGQEPEELIVLIVCWSHPDEPAGQR